MFLAGCFTYLFLRGWGGALLRRIGRRNRVHMLSGPIASYASRT
jgi:hypothetical protein